MSTEKGDTPTMKRSCFVGARALVLALLAAAWTVLSVHDALCQQTPRAQPTWTLAPWCQRVIAGVAARQKANQPLAPGQRATLEQCLYLASRHWPEQTSAGPLLSPVGPNIQKVIPRPASASSSDSAAEAPSP